MKKTLKRLMLMLFVFSSSMFAVEPKEDFSLDKNADISKSSSGTQRLEIIDGIWVSEKYLASLKTNKTPFKGNPESFEINTEGKKLKWTNFHEGYWRNIFAYGKEKNNYFLKVSEPESSSSNMELVRFSIENGALIFSEGSIVEQINERFIKIPSDLSEYANKLILSGSYKDAEGKRYKFTEEGNAIWPELTFDYKLVLDSSEAGCPYINANIKDNQGHPKRFGYKWGSEFLYIFEIVEDGDAPISCAKEPHLKLVKE
jgi:hypothetical protein